MTDTYKARLRVPTHEQYAYIEIDAEGTPESLYEAYSAFTRIVQGNAGLPEKEMNQVVDTMLLDESVKDGVEIYNRMTDTQKYAAQVIKRALKRIKSRQGLEDKEE